MSHDSVHDALHEKGGLIEGAARETAEQTGKAEAFVYGVGSFYHLLARPEKKIRVCTGLSCLMAGAEKVLEAAEKAGLPAEGVSCLAGCDVAPAVLRDRCVLPDLCEEDIQACGGDWEKLSSSATPEDGSWLGHIGPEGSDPESRAINLAGKNDWSASAFAKAQAVGGEAVVAELEKAGLRGCGGAGFPAHLKWKAVMGQPVTERYVVLNADEGEPGTFKDRETLMRRPDLVIEGLAIAAHVIGASDVYLYLRGEFEIPRMAVERAIQRFAESNSFPHINFHIHLGQGAYICGEETALLEALEGKRGMPRLKPPYPVEVGLWGKPTMVHNVETIACVPGIVHRGGPWFKALGKTGGGSKLYCISGHVQRPGTYELPFGVNLDELIEAAGGMVGELKAFSPGGASAGFLPASKSNVPLDFESLAAEGSMLGSAGVVVLNQSVDMVWAAREQARFFEDESCGQCAPCRIGCRFIRETLDRHRDPKGANIDPQHIEDVAWQMGEGSICGLGMTASLPLTSAMKHFPEEFK